jgi:putative transposase
LSGDEQRRDDPPRPELEAASAEIPAWADNGEGPPPGGPSSRGGPPRQGPRAEMAQGLAALRRRVRVLEDEAEIARRLAAFDDGEAARARTYRFIAAESANFAITTLCRVCGVSRSAYYAWAARGEGPDDATIEEAGLANRLYDIWVASRRRYGAPRLTAALWRAGEFVNEKKVARLMGELGIAGICGRRKLHTTRPDPFARPAADLVERDFSAAGPDELWVGDQTYVPTDEGWLFVSSVLDVFSRRLIGWSITDHLRAEAVAAALDAAAATRGRFRFVGTVFHTDKGCQYTSGLFRKKCQTMGIVQSMGTVGDSYDNAMAESLWASFKRELVDQTHYSTRNEARLAIFEWLVWYNETRLHSSIGYCPPVEFEESWSHQEAA